MSITRLIIARHGETEWNVCGRLQNHLDSPLTELGFEQAEALADRLQRMSFDHFYSSDLGRAVATATVISEATGRSFLQDSAFRERAMGCFEGLTWDEARQRFPDHHDAHRADQSLAVPGGESGQEFQARIADACEALASRHPGETVLIVSHGHVLDALLRWTMGIPLSQPRPARLPNASLNIFEKHEEKWMLALWGDVGHLAHLPKGAHP